MIKDLTIKNFKTHRDLEMKDLANVNILLGKNNSGKTAVLEALLLLYYSSNRMFARHALNYLNNWRGYINGADSGEKWNSLFYNLDISKEIYIETKEDEKQNNTENNIRSLSIKPIITGKRPDSLSAIGTIDSSDLSGRTEGLLWTLTYPNGNSIKYQVDDSENETEQQITDDVRNLLISTSKNIPTTFIPARAIIDIRREAKGFSKLEVENRADKIDELLKILRNFEPNLKRLFVAVPHDIRIYGDVGLTRPMPLSLMGDGMLHAFSIALSMVNNQNGLVLIDEIENGLHYSVLTDVWRMILQTSHDLNVQVFATTHSDECIKAAYEAVDSLGYDDSLKLYRFDKTQDKTRVVDYTAKELYSAITSNQEVR
jgi:AAA15 family ATPase/GTPase